MAGEEPRARAERAGWPVAEGWDHEAIHQIVVEWNAEQKRVNPALWRELRMAAFDMRAELHEELPDVTRDQLERVTLCLLGKVTALAFALGLQSGPSERAMGAATSVAGLAVVDELWPQKARTDG